MGKRNRTSGVVAKIAREWKKCQPKIKARRRGGGKAPTKKAKPSRQASYRARQEADRQRANGRTNGTSEAITTPDGRHSFASTSSDGYPLHKQVRTSIDRTPKDLRAKWHGECALPQSLSKALDKGIDPRGSAVGSARIRSRDGGLKGHGTHNPPCDSCKPLMEDFNLREAL